MEISLTKNVEMGVDHEDTTLDDLSMIKNVASGTSGELLIGDKIINDSYSHMYDTIISSAKDEKTATKIDEPIANSSNIFEAHNVVPLLNGNSREINENGTDSLSTTEKAVTASNGQLLDPTVENVDVKMETLNWRDKEAEMVTLTFEPAVENGFHTGNCNNNSVVNLPVSPNLNSIANSISPMSTKLVWNNNSLSRTKTFHASPDLSKSPNIANYKSSIKNRLLAMEKFRVEHQNNHFKASNTATSMLKNFVAYKKAPERSGTFKGISVSNTKKPLQTSICYNNSVTNSRKRSYFGVSEHYFQYLNQPKRARHEPFQIMFKAHSFYSEASPTNAVKFPRASLSWPSGKEPLPGYKVPKRRICRMENFSSNKKRRTIATYRVPRPKPKQQPRYISRNAAWGHRKMPDSKLATNLLTLNTLKWDPSTKKFIMQSRRPQKTQNKCQFFNFPSAVSKGTNLSQKSSKNLFRPQNAHHVSKFISRAIHNPANKSLPVKIPQNIKDVKDIFKCMRTPNPQQYRSLNDYVRMCMLFHIRRQMASKALRSSYVEGKSKPTKLNIGTNLKKYPVGKKSDAEAKVQDKSKKREILNSIILLSLQTELILTKWTNELPYSKATEKTSISLGPGKDKNGFLSCNWLYTCKGELVESAPTNGSLSLETQEDQLCQQAKNAWSYDCVVFKKPVRKAAATKDSEETVKTGSAVSTKIENGDLHTSNGKSILCVSQKEHQNSGSEVRHHPKMQRSLSQMKTLKRDEGVIQKTKSHFPKTSYCVRFRYCFCPIQDDHYSKNCFLNRTSVSPLLIKNKAENGTDTWLESDTPSCDRESIPCSSIKTVPSSNNQNSLLHVTHKVPMNGLCLHNGNISTGSSSPIDDYCVSKKLISCNHIGNEINSRNDYFKNYYGDITEFVRKIGHTDIYHKWSVRRFSAPEGSYTPLFKYKQLSKKKCQNKSPEIVKRRVSFDDRAKAPNHLAQMQPVELEILAKPSVNGETAITDCDIKTSFPEGGWSPNKVYTKFCNNLQSEKRLKGRTSDTNRDCINSFRDDKEIHLDSNNIDNEFEDSDEDLDFPSNFLPYGTLDQNNTTNYEDKTNPRTNRLFFSFNTNTCPVKIPKPSLNPIEIPTFQKTDVCTSIMLHCKETLTVSCLYRESKRLTTDMEKYVYNVGHNYSIGRVGNALSMESIPRPGGSKYRNCDNAPLNGEIPGSAVHGITNITVDAGMISPTAIGEKLIQNKHAIATEAEQNTLLNESVLNLDPITQHNGETGICNEMGNKLFRNSVVNCREQKNIPESDTALTDIGNKVCCEDIETSKMGIENHLTIGKGGAVDLCDELDTSGFDFNGKASLRRLVNDITIEDTKRRQNESEKSFLEDAITDPSLFKNYNVKAEREPVEQFVESRLNEATKENIIKTKHTEDDSERIAAGDGIINDTQLETRSSHRLRSRVSKKRGRYETDYVTDLPKTAKKAKRTLPTRDYSNDEFWQFYRDCEKTEHAKNLALQHKYIKLIKSKEANCQVLPRFAAQSQYSNIICASASLNKNSGIKVPENGLMPFMGRHTKLKKGAVAAELPTSPEGCCPYCGRSFAENLKAVYDSHVKRHEMRYTILSAPILTSSLKKNLNAKGGRKPKNARKDTPVKKARTENATTVVYVDSVSKELPKCARSPEQNKIISAIPKPSNISMGHRKQTARKSFNITSSLPKEALIATLQCKMRLSSPPADTKEQTTSVFNFKENSSYNIKPVTLPKCPPLPSPKKKLPYLIKVPINNKLHTKINNKSKDFRNCVKPGANDTKHLTSNGIESSNCKLDHANKNISIPTSNPNICDNSPVLRKKSIDKPYFAKTREYKRKIPIGDNNQANKKFRPENQKVNLTKKDNRSK